MARSRVEQPKERWTPEQIVFVKENFPTVNTKQIAAELKRSVHSVNHKAGQLKLKKTDAYRSYIRFGPRANYSLNHVILSDLAYVAGLFDGEGWFNFYWQPSKSKSKSKTQGLRVAIGNSDGETLQLLRKTFNLGCISISRTSCKSGTVMTQWTFTGWQAICFLKAILQFLRIRKRDAENAILKWKTDRRAYTGPF